jgi:hypothetical protein
MLYAELL